MGDTNGRGSGKNKVCASQGLEPKCHEWHFEAQLSGVSDIVIMFPRSRQPFLLFDAFFDYLSAFARCRNFDDKETSHGMEVSLW